MLNDLLRVFLLGFMTGVLSMSLLWKAYNGGKEAEGMSSEAYYHCPICKGKLKIILNLGGRLFLVKYEDAKG